MTAIPQSDYPITRLPDYKMRIAVIPGDGSGVDVTAEAVKVVRAVADVFGRPLDLETLPYGADYYLQTGISLPPNGYAMLRDDFDAIYIGALGDPRIPDLRHARDILLGTRFELDLSVNHGPVRLLPAQFQVIVTNNMFGDIVTDLGAQLQGGLGMAASGNLHPGRTSMFEPVHGSAPKYAGKNVANPVGAILSAALMLAYLGLNEEAAAVEAAVQDSVVTGNGTAEIGGTLGTRETGDYIARAIKKHHD